MRFCATHNLHLISDEIYALSTFPNPDYPSAVPFTSVLSIDPTGIIDKDLLHVTYALSKDFGYPGAKIGALVTRNQSLKKAVDAVIAFHSVSGPSVAIVTAMLEDRTWCRAFIEIARKRVAEAYAFATSQLHSLGIKYFEGGNAGFFLWVDLSPYLPAEEAGKSVFDRECELAQKILDAGVFLHPREEHGIRPGWFRIVYTAERGVVEEGMRRLKGALQGIE